MTMIISPTNGIGLLINVFDVEPERQQELIDTWIDFSRGVEQEPGFIAAVLYKSTDGKRLINYAQWEHPADWERFVQKYGREFARFSKIATEIDPHLYEVAQIMGAPK